jgi:hypothetical protein
MHCPRRDELGGSDMFNLPKEDDWQIREQLSNGIVARHCSYCGSMHPDDFMAIIKDGGTVGPTDKNYKAYITDKNGKESKFYYVHLSKEQKIEFIDLYNNRTMKIGMPGNFYNFPYFMSKVKSDS